MSTSQHDRRDMMFTSVCRVKIQRRLGCLSIFPLKTEIDDRHREKERGRKRKRKMKVNVSQSVVLDPETPYCSG